VVGGSKSSRPDQTSSMSIAFWPHGIGAGEPHLWEIFKWPTRQNGSGHTFRSSASAAVARTGFRRPVILFLTQTSRKSKPKRKDSRCGVLSVALWQQPKRLTTTVGNRRLAPRGGFVHGFKIDFEFWRPTSLLFPCCLPSGTCLLLFLCLSRLVSLSLSDLCRVNSRASSGNVCLP